MNGFRGAGLVEEIYTITDDTAYYDFDSVLVVREKATGKVFVAHDAGCSCPIPFETHVFPTDFSEVRSAAELRDFAESFEGHNTYGTKYSTIDNAIEAAGLH